MRKELKRLGTLYRYPVILSYDPEEEYGKYRLEIVGNGHYFQDEKSAIHYFLVEYYNSKHRQKLPYDYLEK